MNCWLALVSIKSHVRCAINHNIESSIFIDKTLTYIIRRHLSYQRAKRNTNPNTSLLQIEGVDSIDGARYVTL